MMWGNFSVSRLPTTAELSFCPLYPFLEGPFPSHSTPRNQMGLALFPHLVSNTTSLATLSTLSTQPCDWFTDGNTTILDNHPSHFSWGCYTGAPQTGTVFYLLLKPSSLRTTQIGAAGVILMSPEKARLKMKTSRDWPS